MTTATTQRPHCAKFSKALLPVMAEQLAGYRVVLDPMAGVGTLARYLDPTLHIVYSNEIEAEWASQCPPPWSMLDARDLSFFADGFADAIGCSPDYGNRMSDHHNAQERCRKCQGSGSYPLLTRQVCPKCKGVGKNTYVRHTYRHYLGRPLSKGSSAGLRWGPKYRDLQTEIMREAIRVLRPGGRYVWNVSDHIKTIPATKTRAKAQVVQPVSAWHRDTLISLGLTHVRTIDVPTPRNQHGANGKARVEFEQVHVLDKP